MIFRQPNKTVQRDFQSILIREQFLHQKSNTKDDFTSLDVLMTVINIVFLGDIDERKETPRRKMDRSSSD